MVDLTAEMADLWAALGPPAPGRGRVLQFVSARTGEGGSTVAREFARLAAVRGRRPAWLIDADVYDQSQLNTVGLEPHRFGPVQGLASASPDGSAFFTIQPPLKDRHGRPLADSRLLQARAVLGGRLWVTRLRGEALHAAQRVQFLASGRYWEAMRKHADYVIVDSPAADRSDASIALAPHVDASILVVAADETGVGDPAALRDALEAAGGKVAGMVFNRVAEADLRSRA
ncbi:MAG: hfsB [Caulobacteraceae bacterium]|nr:hfsB [Caulobacteraceae bacterium]